MLLPDLLPDPQGLIRQAVLAALFWVLRSTIRRLRAGLGGLDLQVLRAQVTPDSSRVTPDKVRACRTVGACCTVGAYGNTPVPRGNTPVPRGTPPRAHHGRAPPERTPRA